MRRTQEEEEMGLEKEKEGFGGGGACVEIRNRRVNTPTTHTLKFYSSHKNIIMCKEVLYK